MKRKLFCFLILMAAYSVHSQCTQAIVAPWMEDFETFPATTNFTGFNCWTEVSPNAPDWNVDGAGSTPSSNTGPSGAFSGSRYFYLETSSGVQGQSADLTSPMININSLSNPAISFWYHMFGSNMDSLQVWVTDVTTGNSTNVWGIFGQQHSAAGDPWTQQVITLPGFSDSIQITFRGFRGTSFRGDMSIDDVSVIDCTPTFSSINAQSCGFYTAPSGKLFHDAGTYVDTISNSVGCDSIITINLTTTNTFSTINPTACTYTSPSGKVWGASGTYFDTIPNNAGCDSVITINLTSNNSTNSFSTTACNVYTAPSGAEYTASGVYMDTITNSVGCDSIQTITVTVNYNDNLTIFITTCGDPYTSDAGNTYTSTGVYIENNQTINGCDSTVYIDVLISEGNSTTIPIDACEEFTSDAGITYTTSGSHVEEYVGVTGCDSIRTYDVTIHTVDPTVTLIGNDIIEANEAGATYQWVDCNNDNAPIAGETNQTFTATVNGDYACIITTPYCSEMSECIRINDAIGLGIGDETNVFSMYPNPSTGLFTVELNDLTDNTLIVVSDAAGQIVYSEIVSSNLTNINLEDVEAGMYFISVSNTVSKSVKSIVIE